MKSYTVLKIIGGLLMILIGVWCIPIVSSSIVSSKLNQLIASFGLGIMIGSSYLESKGEI